jgi:predicted metalloprotease with PDZ domain
MQGWDSLSMEEKDLVPKPDLSHSEHRTLIRTIFESADLPHQMKGAGLEMMFEGLYRAQSAWDEVMSFNAHQAQIRDRTKLIVLAGSGHLIYNLGINRRVFEKNELPFKTVVAVPVPKEKGKVQVSRSLADYIWGIPEEDRPAFPTVGIKFKTAEGIKNLIIEREPIEGVAKGADLKAGDVIISVDGERFHDINELKMYLAQFTWGDDVVFRLLREAKEIDVVLKFQYTPEEE